MEEQNLLPTCDLNGNVLEIYLNFCFSIKVLSLTFSFIIHFFIFLSPVFHLAPVVLANLLGISPVNPHLTFFELVFTVLIYSTLGLCTSIKLLLFCGDVKESEAQQGKKGKESEMPEV